MPAPAEVKDNDIIILLKDALVKATTTEPINDAKRETSYYFTLPFQKIL